jgi:Tfp pilus assembly protein PilO
LVPALGLGLVILVNYGVHRVRPALAAQEELAAQEAQLDQSPLPAAEGSGRDLRLLESKIARVQARLERTRPLATPRQAADLELRLADLAQGSGLQLSSTAPLAPEARPAPRRRGQTQELQEPLRPRGSWRLVGSYAGLQSFVAGLDDLPWRVSLTSLGVERRPDGQLEIHCEISL